ncbi:MAG: phosphatidylserine decarboxylase [Bacteriovoracales bacterium]
MDIKFYNRETKEIEIEKVYGDKAVRWLYGSTLGKLLTPLVCSSAISHFYGLFQSSPTSKKKIKPFIENFHINMDDYIEEDFASFNDFFIRKFKEGKRNYPTDPNSMGAPCEARYFAYKKIVPDLKIPVKGKYLTPENLIKNEKWNKYFQNGPVLLARLCPVDYHRFHYPDSGFTKDFYPIHGKLHSVNPIALKKHGTIFMENERRVSILETESFGKLAYIEVGATMVGKIVQTHLDKSFKRGDEKGYFLFGGSTVIVIGEEGKWLPDADLLENTANNFETYVKLGNSLAKGL